MAVLDTVTSYLDVSTVLVFILILFVSFSYLEWRRVAKLPPGPTGIPYFGYGPFFDKSIPLWMLSRDFAKRYNSDITSMNLYGTTTIFLTSREAVKEAFQKRHEMAERPKRSFFKTLDPTHNGIISSSGPLWKEQRRFALLMLRDFGMGKIAAEQNIQDEAINLCQHFQDLGKDIARDPLAILEPAVSNIICAMGFGKRFLYDDPKFNAALKGLNFLVSPQVSPYSRLRISKNLHWIAPLLYPDIKRAAQEKYDLISEFIRGIIDEHKRKFDGSVNDLIDGFLVEQSKRTDANHSFTDDQLRHVIFDLFVAGSETTTSTLRWALFYLIKSPDIQERIYREISSVIGTDRVPNMSDKKSTPFTEAFLLEIQRFKTLVPMSVPHTTSEDLQLMGYTIPANSTIVSNLGAIHRDPSDFEDPDTFRIERFLNGDKVIDADKLDQFGIGRRACAGEALARMEIYIFFTTMVQRLQFVSAKDQDIDMNYSTPSGLQAPKPFLLHAICREEIKFYFTPSGGNRKKQ